MSRAEPRTVGNLGDDTWEVRNAHAEWTRLVRTTRRLLSTDSGQSLTVQGILAASSLSTRAFYRHFDSKEDLVATVLRADARQIEDQLLRDMAAVPTPDAAIIAWVDFWVTIAFSSSYTKQVRAVMVGDLQVADAFESVRQHIATVSRSVVALTIATGLEQGVFTQGAPFHDARAFHALVDDVIERRVYREPVASRTRTRQELTSFIGRALGSDLHGAND
jgi:AcrR family transcriptional regulator